MNTQKRLTAEIITFAPLALSLALISAFHASRSSRVTFFSGGRKRNSAITAPTYFRTVASQRSSRRSASPYAVICSLVIA